ncbi:hypothetical protein AVEN_22905-1 [Araneus ventricosus]|uniref:Uncharacterized protein n=1 Tax=Araneus ventricosus TaxID=182803 RepID=A0A4Y2D6L9_ARAVE|nr:hypothetical protein AVEN_22905-1 [Araneus ventricosus]
MPEWIVWTNGIGIGSRLACRGWMITAMKGTSSTKSASERNRDEGFLREEERIFSDVQCQRSDTDDSIKLPLRAAHATIPRLGTTCHRKWALRVTPPLYTHQGSDTPLTYPTAYHPRTRGGPQWDEVYEKVQGKALPLV